MSLTALDWRGWRELVRSWRAACSVATEIDGETVVERIRIQDE
jgi:hypothetical protein